MIDFTTLKTYCTEFPELSNFIENTQPASLIPEEHKEQIHFLNSEATDFLCKYFEYSRIQQGVNTTKKDWKPFRENYFKTIVDYNVYNPEQEVKKWLYNRHIRFSKYVYAIGANRQAVMLTWKMVIKYYKGLFTTGRIIIDESLNWCLFYYKDGQLFFGKDKIFNPEEEYENMYQLHELKNKYPFLKLPY